MTRGTDETVTTGMVANIRQVGEPRLSPDGRWIAWLEAWAGRGDIQVAPVAGGPPVTVTTDPTIRPSVTYGGGILAWTPDSAQVAYVAADGYLWFVDRGGGAPRRLLDRAGIAAPALAGTHLVFMVADEAGSDIGHVDAPLLDTATTATLSWPERLPVRGDFCFDPDVAADGVAAWHEWDVPDMPWDGGRIVTCRPGGNPRVVDGEQGVAVGSPRFSPDGSQLAYVSDRTGRWALWVAGVDGDERRLVADAQGEIGGPAWSPGDRYQSWSPDGSQLAYLVNHDARTSVHIVDVKTGESRPIAGGEGTWSDVTWSGSTLATVYTDFDTPREVRLLDPRSGTHRTVSSPGTGRFPRLGRVTHLEWPGDDGAPVYGIHVEGTREGPREGAGRGGAAHDPRLLVWPHGGPNGQSVYAFNARLHWFTSRGWDVLFVNHRGSTGYGREHTQGLRRHWGEADVDDTAAGVRHVHRTGLSATGPVAVMGGSAGGYLALRALQRHPDLFDAGVSLFGIADLFRLAETTHRFEAHSFDTLVGELPEAWDTYRARSPLYAPEPLARPVLILQGGRDVVVPPEQAEALASRARSDGAEVELHVYPDEGHGWGRPEVVADELGRIEGFLRRHVLRVAR